MSERYRLRYHPGATDDLFNIFTLIEDYAGTDIANRKFSEIERVTKAWSTFRIRQPLGTRFVRDFASFRPPKRRSSASRSTKLTSPFLYWRSAMPVRTGKHA
ncbi:hypothetical protein [Rhizobium sp. Rhizsp82]|uniref:hypothetical protein n=1 Tax=Rhizobium sp. Rhizsp82 TaxID=3243057 RepID=UPI0039B52965